MTMRNERNAGKWYRACLAATLLPALLLVHRHTMAADSGTPAAPGKERAVTLESVAGSPIKRVVLSAKAAQRIDLQTGAVGEQAVALTQIVGGIVVDPSAAGASPQTRPAAAAASGSKAVAELWIRVVLSPPEWSRLAKDRSARIVPLVTRANLAPESTAMLTDRPPLESAKSGMLSVFYVLPPDGGLVLGDRVRVELPFEGGSDKHKVVPYSAVYYDAKGDAWVYVNTAPLAFVRQRVAVERVSGNLAVLSSGPEIGTPVATVGVALLYGAEIFGK